MFTSDIVMGYKQPIRTHPCYRFHLSLSGCSMGSLETCTHVIPMLESHTHFFLLPNVTLPTKGNKNVVISSMCRLKGDVNVVISDILNITRDLSFAYCVELQAMLSVNQ